MVVQVQDKLEEVEEVLMSLLMEVRDVLGLRVRLSPQHNPMPLEVRRLTQPILTVQHAEWAVATTVAKRDIGRGNVSGRRTT